MRRLLLVLTALVLLLASCSKLPTTSPSTNLEEAGTLPQATDTLPPPTPPTPTPTEEIIVETAPSIPTDGLVLHMPFDGSLSDSIQGFTAQAISTSSVPGRFGDPDSALIFNGLDSLLVFPVEPELDLTGAFTIAFFIQGNAQSDHEWLILTKHQAGVCQPEDTSWMIRYQAEMGLRFVNYDTSVECGKVILAAPEVNLLDDRWHHIAWVYDPDVNSLRIYVDGALAAEALDTDLNIQSNNIPLIIGNQYQGVAQHALDAAIDDLYIYHAALSPEQVGILADAGR